MGKVQRRVGPYRVLTLQMLCVFEGSRLDTPWHCPMERCYFTTDVRRARASHLLRSHHRLFEGNRRAPRLLVGQELAERLEAFRLRNRGSRQRARENQRAARAAASVGGGLAESASAETPMADPPASPDEDWGDAAIDWDSMLEEGPFSAEAYQLLEGEEQETTSEEPQESAEGLATGAPPGEQDPFREWLTVPYVPPPPSELEGLPGGVDPPVFVEQVLAWAADGMSYPHILQAARIRWEIRDEFQVPLQNLAVMLVLGSRRLVAQGLMESSMTRLQEDPSGGTLLAGFLTDILNLLD